MKIAVILTSDPTTCSTSDEALGRALNALVLTHEAKHRGDDVTLQFFGAGVRWAIELANADHPGHALYTAVQDRVGGASVGCANLRDLADQLSASGVELLGDYELPGGNRTGSIARLMADGYQIVTF